MKQEARVTYLINVTPDDLRKLADCIVEKTKYAQDGQTILIDITDSVTTFTLATVVHKKAST